MHSSDADMNSPRWASKGPKGAVEDMEALLGFVSSILRGFPRKETVVTLHGIDLFIQDDH